MPQKHGFLPRGLAAAGEAKSKQTPGQWGAKFGRLFPDLPAAHYGASEHESKANLALLAKAMISDFDEPKDGPDDEESGIPALYTYFGQFIDHDLTFDPNGSFAKQKDPSAVTDFRTPAFDLDNLYGRGPGDQPYLYEDDGKSLRLGDPLTMGSPGATDLQRNAAGRALIGDPRNDENSIVSQLQGLMIRFHNGLVKRFPQAAFEEVQAMVRHHYQYVVVNDFLARIVRHDVLDGLKTDGHYDKARINFFKGFPAPYDAPFMPVEFSVAAYRLGHSMVRPGYRLNDTVLLPIFPIPVHAKPGFPEGLTGFRRMISDWAIDWGRFIDIDERDYGLQPDPTKVSDGLTPVQEVENFRRLQFAYRIDTALVDPLAALPTSVADNPPPSLAARNLERGLEFGLPTGQAVAAAMGAPVLDDKDILIGQAVPGAETTKIAEIAGGAFANNCPLWTYVLAEAMHGPMQDTPIPVKGGKVVTTPQLGPVGGRIVAEVFLGLLFADKGSYLHMHPAWSPPEGPDYRLKDLVAAALAS